MNLTESLKQKADTGIFGVADAVAYGRKAPSGHRPGDFMEGARSIVLVGLRLLDLPLDGIPGTRTEYTADFHTTNAELNRKMFEVAGFLQAEGYGVLPVPYLEMPGWNLDRRPAWSLKALRHLMSVPAVRKAVNAGLWENLSFRHMAVEAGLGEIGVSNLLLHPLHGPRVRFTALLTDAELETGVPLEPSLCRPERCGFACVEACPAGAIPGGGAGTDKAACLRYYIKLGIPGMSGLRCGICVARCPVHRPQFREA